MRRVARSSGYLDSVAFRLAGRLPDAPACLLPEIHGGGVGNPCERCYCLEDAGGAPCLMPDLHWGRHVSESNVSVMDDDEIDEIWHDGIGDLVGRELGEHSASYPCPQCRVPGLEKDPKNNDYVCANCAAHFDPDELVAHA